MVLCIIAAIVFAVMSIFSAKYRPLAKEGFRCVFRTIMLKPCDTGLDERIKAELVSGLMKYTPGGARFANKHFAMISWVFVILTIASFGYTIYGFYNFYYYGNCDGPQSAGVCILNDITGDYGRFSEPKDLISPTNLDGITAGDPNSTVTVVEFGCFSCPYTGQAEYTMKELLDDNKIYYVFKPFPLPNHEGSYDSAIAVLCANKQGKQWELRQKIFAQQLVCAEEGGQINIKELAADAGLEMQQFNQCYDNRETATELDGYIQQGKDANIYATPTFFVNGKPVVGPQSLVEFEKIIDGAN
ncbi:MAG: thioredoxin domain-containing protein [Candidatus Micrarchaeota archaeon]